MMLTSWAICADSDTGEPAVVASLQCDACGDCFRLTEERIHSVSEAEQVQAAFSTLASFTKHHVCQPPGET